MYTRQSSVSLLHVPAQNGCHHQGVHSVAKVDLNACASVWLFLPSYHATDHSEGVTLALSGIPDDGIHDVPKQVGGLLTSDL
jgi:hypothetical protein